MSPDRVGRHGSRGYPPAGAENASRSRPRGDDRARPPIASVVASSSSSHPQLEMDSPPPQREPDESHHRHRSASDRLVSRAQSEPLVCKITRPMTLPPGEKQDYVIRIGRLCLGRVRN